MARRIQNRLPRESPRRRILKAARSHFLSHGFRRVTMDDLAAELQISKKTLYAHFPGKEALLEAVMQDKYRSIDASLSQVPRPRQAGFAPALLDLVARVQRELKELGPPFLRDMRTAPEIFKRLERRRARLIREHFGRLFREGQRAGDVRTDMPLDLMIDTLLAVMHGIMNPAKLEELGLPPAKAFSGVIDLLLYGAVKRKGGKRR
jgi:AcrR family transcriptional regulator